MKINTLSQSPARLSFLAFKALMDFPFKVLLLYCKNNGNLALFYQELTEINRDRILCDLNISFIEQNSQVSQLLSDYVQIVSEPTQISESLLDQLLVNFQLIQYGYEIF